MQDEDDPQEDWEEPDPDPEQPAVSMEQIIQDAIDANRKALATSKVPSDWPTQLHTADKSSYLEVFTDKLTVQYTASGNHDQDHGSIRSNMPGPCGQAVHYFELKVLDAGRKGKITIGLTTKDFCLDFQPGKRPGSYGYRGDEGKKFDGGANVEHLYGPFFTSGDVVGCGVNWRTNSIFFTKNGRNLGPAFSDVRGIYYPTVCLHSENEVVTVNFGQYPFKFDLAGFMADERSKAEIVHHAQDVDFAVLPPLVADYLKHGAYPDTLRALELATASGTVPSDDKEEADTDSVRATMALRKRVRTAILDGNIPSTFEMVKDCLGIDNFEEAFGLPCSVDPDLDSATASPESIASGSASEDVEMAESTLKAASESSTKVASESAASASLSVESAAGTGTESSHAENRRQLLLKIVFQLHCQQFIELVRSGDQEVYLKFAQEVLSRYSGRPDVDQRALTDVVSLLAFADTSRAPPDIARLVTPEQRQLTATIVNQAVLEYKGGERVSTLEVLLTQLLTSFSVYREQNYGMGSVFDL